MRRENNLDFKLVISLSQNERKEFKEVNERTQQPFSEQVQVWLFFFQMVVFEA